MSELLAPVGGEEALVAAIQNGANAVYLSGGSFGARAFAKNFDKASLIDAIRYAHIRDVKVYVTVNTLIKKSEMAEAKDYVDFLYENDVDAIIVQDFGLADHIRKKYPDLDLHASTQMSAHSLEDVRFLKEFGFSRVVVAREMCVEEIKKIKEAVDVELEVFVHGALCVSYSGQCLMSSMIGGRSGNRGRCAQPCRQRYTILDETSYTISPKDLNFIQEVKVLEAAGVDSLKIEGRMKGPEYAATVVASYRNALTSQPTEDLNRVFNRTYTEGYLKHENIIASDAPGNRGERIGTVYAYDAHKKMLTIALEKNLNKGDEIQIRRDDSSVGARCDVFYQEGRRIKAYKANEPVTVDFKYDAKPGEVIYRTYDTEMMQLARESYRKEVRKISVDMFLLCTENELVLKVSDGVHEVVVESDILPEKAMKVALDYNKLKKQLQKLGSTPYELNKCDIFLDPDLSLPIKVINDLRRQCTDTLDEKRSIKYNRKPVIFESETHELKEEPLAELTIAVRNKAQYDAVADLGLDVYSMTGDGIPRLPRITAEESIYQYDKNKLSLVGTYGQVGLIEDAYVDYSLNVYNQDTINAYADLNVKRVTLSYELAKYDLTQLKPNQNQDLEYIVYGYTPVMIMAYCPITKKPTHCDDCAEPCQDDFVLKDRFDEDYQLIRNGDRLEVLHSKRINLIHHLDDLIRMNIRYFRLDFTTETSEEVREITEAYMKALKGNRVRLSFEDEFEGHYAMGVE